MNLSRNLIANITLDFNFLKRTYVDISNHHPSIQPITTIVTDTHAHINLILNDNKHLIPIQMLTSVSTFIKRLIFMVDIHVDMDMSMKVNAKMNMRMSINMHVNKNMSMHVNINLNIKPNTLMLD